MGIVETIKDITATLVQVPTLLALKKGMKPRSFDEKDSFAARVERNVENFPDRIAIIFEGKSLTWREASSLKSAVTNSRGLMPTGISVEATRTPLLL